MADRLRVLGPLVAVVVREESGQLVEHRVDGRLLAWNERTGRLWSARPTGGEGEASADGEAWVREFTWAAGDAAVGVDLELPTGRGRRVGLLDAVVYAARKGAGTACEEWEHWFQRPPEVRRIGREWAFFGVVEVTERGIIS